MDLHSIEGGKHSMTNDLKNIIEGLIAKKGEGSYWDFKQQWNDGGDLLKDIICLANNTDNKDAYLVFGVAKDLRICGINSDTRRKSQNEISNFVGGKSFLSDCPEVEIETICFDENQVDVIVIKATTKVPYILQKDYKPALADCIYSRRNDTNTGGEGNPTTIDMIDRLFKIRYGIDKSIMEKLSILLDEQDQWGCFTNGNHREWKQGGDWGNKNYIFHRYFPEFRVEIEQDLEKRRPWSREPLMCFYSSDVFYTAEAKIMYHSTILFDFDMIVIDDFRLYIPNPNKAAFVNKHASNKVTGQIQFYYFTLDSIEGKLFSIITKGRNDTHARDDAESIENKWLIQFENQGELKEFIRFAEHNPDLYDKKVNLVQGEEIEKQRGNPSSWPSSEIIQAGNFYKVWKLWHHNQKS